MINTLGPTQDITSREGHTKSIQRPEVIIANQAFVRVFQLLKEFGFNTIKPGKGKCYRTTSKQP